ncbi:MAG: magnesium transporter, partial [Verrucomicrobia bacterium 21-51-4]
MPERYHAHPEAQLQHIPEPINKEYTLELLLSLQPDDFEALDVERLAQTPPHIVAAFLERHDVDDRRRVLRKLSEEDAMEVLADMDSEDTAETVGAMREWRALKILESMDPDDAADVVADLEEEDRERLLDKLDPETAATMRELLQYGEDTAGGIMNPEVVTIAWDATVDEAIQHIRKMAAEDEKWAHLNFNYIYVLDNGGRLEGVVSLKELILARPYQKVSDIAQTSLQGICHPNDDKEEVARALANLDLSALPVIDNDRKLLGIITYDDVIDIIQDEATEDIQKLVGAGANESILDSLSYSVSKRSPWLIVNLFTAFMAAGVVSLFKPEIEQFTLLAVFMPVIASLGGNTGSQTLAVAIRSLALGELHPGDNWQVCISEAMKGLLNGVLVGGTAAVITWLLTRETLLAGVVF